ncbi:hypothetical protein F4821DRAFT_245300 [Hypoxylon rubiginosum]|uniref:Uncharacterized protein n=1 Tax=Hypoxylon rubiginosum TaxID=110542 RepID=A0ACC0CS37_9PEZI|nr:hypothetical protein F4821DRAFT_245300 [Hypoxylon rubiginosum]
MESLKYLSISDVPSLTALPAEIFHIILSHLDTARSVSHLALTCKGLYRLIRDCGWRIFVTSRFNTLSLPEISSQDEWAERARALTSQSRDWDRRAFTIDVLKPPMKHNARNYNRFSPQQSIASNILVDAHHQRTGNDAQDLIFWGAGEDIFGLVRHTRGSKAKAPLDEWLVCKGSSTGYRSGRDDVTCVSILKDKKYTFGEGDDPQVLVGRANGGVDVISMATKDFGKELFRFRGMKTVSNTPNDNTVPPTQIQSFDVNYERGLLATATKQSVLFYHLASAEQNDSRVASKNETDAVKAHSDSVNEAWADEVIPLKEESRGNQSFEFIRSIKFVNESTLAVGLNKCGDPLQYLKRTETGFEKFTTAKTNGGEYAADDYTYRTVRAILPVNTSSVASGGGNSVLSSWDDGTVRLQDLRTPLRVDKIFQDNFDLTTPINSLLTRGLERFVAGSAYSPVLKVFDYRWPKGYYHTESLPCGTDHPYPSPRPPTMVFEPSFPDSRSRCDYMAGRPCRWHALSRHDFYRPNMTLWLPAPSERDSSPVYSLASPADDSPSLFAGLAGGLAEMTAKSGSHWLANPSDGTQDKDKDNAPYRRTRARLAFIETGSGFPVDDFAQAQRVPPMHHQVLDGGRGGRNKTRGRGGRGGRSDKTVMKSHTNTNAPWQARSRFDEWIPGGAYVRD